MAKFGLCVLRQITEEAHQDRNQAWRDDGPSAGESSCEARLHRQRQAGDVAAADEPARAVRPSPGGGGGGGDRRPRRGPPPRQLPLQAARASRRPRRRPPRRRRRAAARRPAARWTDRSPPPRQFRHLRLRAADQLG